MIVALASNAPFTFLDEPILGLDANHRDLFYRLVVEHFAHNPRCIVISTHLIEECAALLDHVVVLHRGRLLLDEDTERTLSRGYSVTGPAAAVAAYAAGRSVYGEQNLGGMTTAYLEGRPEGPAPSNLEFGRLDLQQLFIQLTTIPKEGEYKMKRSVWKAPLAYQFRNLLFPGLSSGGSSSCSRFCFTSGSLCLSRERNSVTTERRLPQRSSVSCGDARPGGMRSTWGLRGASHAGCCMAAPWPAWRR